MRLLIVLIVLGMTVRGVAAQPAPAPSTAEREQAVALFKEGLHHYQLAEFPQAVEAFKASYRLVPDPELLFNIAQSYRRMGPDGCAPALDFYRNYRVALDEHRTKYPAGLAASIEQMQHCVDEHRVQSPPPAAVAAPVPPTPATPVTRPEPVVAAQTPPSPPRRSHRLELGLATGGVVAAGLGTWLLVTARTTAAELWAQCGSACPRGSIDDVRLRERLGAGFAVGSGALVVGAIVVWFMHRGQQSTSGMSLGTSGSSVLVSGTF